ncbi:hypothetical protein [Streptomyces sp. NPDC001348]
MPFASEELRLDLACGRGLDGDPHGRVGLSVDARALRRLGLHPDQPSAANGVSPPARWHASGERYAARYWR